MTTKPTCACCNPKPEVKQEDLPEGTYKDDYGYRWLEGDSYSGYLWMSFVGEEGFLGVIITEATNIVDGTKKQWDAEINPGGEVLGDPLAKSSVDKLDDITPWLDRLLNDEEAIELQEVFSQ